MKYLLLICASESAELSPAVEASAGSDIDSWLEEMNGRGVRLQGNQLRPAGDGRTVRARGGQVLIADGPFAETKEQVAGYDILECADLDEAIEVASKHPVARFGAIEVRPFWVD